MVTEKQKQEQKNAVWEEFRRIVKPALEEYLRIVKPAREEYKRIKDAAEEEYKRIEEPAREEYERKIKKINAQRRIDKKKQQTVEKVIK